jgi:hypothetical protein
MSLIRLLVLLAYKRDSCFEVFKCVTEFKIVPVSFSWSPAQGLFCAAVLQLI